MPRTPKRASCINSTCHLAQGEAVAGSDLIAEDCKRTTASNQIEKICVLPALGIAVFAVVPVALRNCGNASAPCVRTTKSERFRMHVL
eukprot:6194322-Pleurochrysis_carterae.AAC.2